LSDIELIFVDDASTDNSLASIERIARADPRVRYIVHESNVGTARSRCAGIELSNSPYVMHVDDDDYVAKDFCRQMLLVAEREKCDLVCANAYADRAGRTEPVYRDAPIGRLADPGLILSRYFRSRAWHVWRYIVRRELFEKAKSFVYTNMPPGLVYDDVYLSYCMWVHAGSVVGIPDRLYYHCYDNPGSVTSSTDPSNGIRHIRQAAKVHAFIEEDLANRGMDQSVKRTYERHVLARNAWNSVRRIEMMCLDEATRDELLSMVMQQFSPRMLLYLSPDSEVRSDRSKASGPAHRMVHSLLPLGSSRRRFVKAVVRGKLATTLRKLARAPG
jgi:glycosyltransferase involved in cell wall biosynthesis